MCQKSGNSECLWHLNVPMCLPVCCVGGVLACCQEASISWEKRQAEVRAKVQQEADMNAWTSWWDNMTGGRVGA